MRSIFADYLSGMGIEAIMKKLNASKYTSTPSDFKSRTVWSNTTVFRANRDIDFVMMRSMFPARHSASSPRPS